MVENKEFYYFLLSFLSMSISNWGFIALEYFILKLFFKSMGDGSAGRYLLPGKHEDMSPIIRTPKKSEVSRPASKPMCTHRKVHTELLSELMA